MHVQRPGGTHITLDWLSRPRYRRRRRAAALAVALAGFLALPAGAQESPEPTPSSSPTPSPSPSPSPTPTPDPSPSAAPAPLGSAETVRPSTTERPDRPKRKKPRRQRKLRWHARQTSEPLRAKRGCQPFGHMQTYMTWGPAVAYGEPVTVVYEATQCTKPSGTAAELSMQGTATMYRGTQAEGSPIDTRPFTVTGLWDRPKNPAGWPPTWWACDVKLARYSWDIAGVYTFEVTARWGVWSLEIATLGAAPSTFHWTHNACS